MRYTFDAPDAPTTKQVQYYEMFGHRALIADGWKAVTRHTPGVPFEDDTWELYHYDVDRSECHDLAAERPDLLAELVARWWVEAEDQGVLPLDDRSIELFFTRYRDRSVHPTDRRYTYFPPMAPLPAQVAPGMGGRGFDLAATIDRPAGAGGVLFATGTENSGHQRLRAGGPAGVRLQLLQRPPRPRVHGPGARSAPPWSASGSVAGGPGAQPRSSSTACPAAG